MLQRLSQSRPVDRGSLLFSGTNQPKLSSQRSWPRMISQRPLLVIGGVWLGLICVSALAYHQLMLTKPDPAVNLPPPTPSMAAPLAPLSVEGAESLRVPASTPVEAPKTSPIGAGWLLSLVGLCGLGCWLITRRAQVAPRRSGPGVVARPRLTAPPSRKQSTPKRLAPYRPDQDTVVMAPLPANLQAPPEGQPDPKPAPLVPDLVPDQEDLPLDWSEASLADSLDLRQRRSLSSLI